MGIADQIASFLRKEVALSEVAPQISAMTPLVSSGLLDSVSKLKLVVFLERTFRITIEAKDLEDGCLETIASIEELVRSRMT